MDPEAIDRAISAALRDVSPLPSSLDFDDLRQEVWVRLLEDRGFDADAESATLYVYKTAKSIVLNTLRDAASTDALPKDLSDRRSELSRYDDMEEREYRTDLLRRRIATMSPADQRILILRFSNGLTIRQIARRLKRSFEAARKRLHLAIKRLKAIV